MGSLTLTEGSALVVQLNGSAAGTGYDQVVVTGSVALNGAALDATRLAGYLPAAGTEFTLIDNDEAEDVTGTFAGLAEGDDSTCPDSTSASATLAGPAMTWS